MAVIALAAITLAGCGLLPRSYLGQPLDPDAANVVPGAGPDAATIEATTPKDFLAPGIEGAVLFIRLVDADGRTVLDRPFEFRNDRQRIPPGTYQLTGYWRVCDANCGNLGAEGRFCQASVTAAPRARLVMAVVPSVQVISTCILSGG